jgi:acetyltransferase-like isoleucine patch superfamily enzyme
MKKILKLFLKSFLRLCYPHFRNEEYYTTELLKFAFMQKILGFNRKVPWPVHFTSTIKCPEKIVRGTKSPGMGIASYIDGRNGIIIGENVWIGPRVSIISMNHDNEDYYKYEEVKPIVIRKNSILLTSCIILPGVELGEHTVVAAGAVVTKSFPEGDQVIGGNPAKQIKKLNPYKERIQKKL